MLTDEKITEIALDYKWEPVIKFARAIEQAARAEALEEAAKLCETKEIAFSIDVWAESTKKQMTAHTAIALAHEIRALINKEQAQ